MATLYERHAALYDMAFDWDVGEEVEWLLDRLGVGCRSVLEPGCGSGRMLAALARCGVEAVGIDRSGAMLALARARLAAVPTATVYEEDIRQFDLGRRFGGAICPINTLAHLTPCELGAHLRCMARHLTPGGRYVIQLAVSGGASLPEPSQWECDRAGTRLRVTWSVESIDVAARQERHLARIEIVSGERAGEVIEDRVSLTHWTPEVLARCIAISPFTRRSCYDGDAAGWPVLEPAVAVGGLVWHELSLQ